MLGMSALVLAAPDSTVTHLSVPDSPAVVSCVAALGGVLIMVTKVGGSTILMLFGVSSVYKP